MFVIDDSGSIRDNNPPNGYDQFDHVKDFVADVTERLDIGLQKSLVGVILFSSTANVVFGVTQHTDQFSLANAIYNLPYRGGVTETAIALDLLHTAGQPGGALNLRNDSIHIAVLLTDGVSDYPQDTETAARALHESNIYDQVYAIGVTNQINLNELKTIASDPSFVFNSTGFDILHMLEETVTQQLIRCIGKLLY